MLLYLGDSLLLQIMHKFTTGTLHEDWLDAKNDIEDSKYFGLRLIDLLRHRSDEVDIGADPITPPHD